MNWEVTPKNPDVAAAFSAYKNYVLDIATHYAGSRLIEHCDISPTSDNVCLAISDDFAEPLTTTRTVGELRSSLESGEYGQICLRQATIQLCTAFEVFFDTISAIYGIPDKIRDPVKATYKPVSDFPITLGNKSIKQIRRLHDDLSIDSVLNDDEVLVKLSSIVEARNCIVHSAGIIQDAGTKLKLSAYSMRHNIGERLHIPGNKFDDFLHYMGIHIVAFVKKLPKRVPHKKDRSSKKTRT